MKTNLQFKKDLCFFDLETTGTDTKNSRIIEAFFRRVYSDPKQVCGLVNKELRILCNPGVPIPKEASDVHGITDMMVKDCPVFKAYAKDVLDIIQDTILIGFNSNRFDSPLLYNELKRCGLDWNYLANDFIDIGNIFKRKEERTLSAAVRFYLGREHEGAHGAKSDVLASESIFREMLERYELPTEERDLAKFSNFDSEIVDLSGCFAKNERGEIVFNIGKNKGKLASSEKSYLDWMLKPESGFNADTLAIAKLVKGGKEK